MSAAAEAASIPDQAAIERAEAFTRERFVHDGEDPAVALAPGSGRRRALDDALREIDAGATVPSTRWRRRYALLLGLERVLSEDEPRLADGTLLNPHQVDALSGTLTALLAAVQNGHSLAGPAAAPVLAVDDEPEPETPAAAAPDEPEDDDEPELDVDEDDDADDDEPEIEAVADEDDEDDDEDDDEPESDDEDDEDDEPEDVWEDDAEPEVDEDVEEGAADDPNAHKRFWFEHATGAGKTVAAMGFVEASRTGGVLILTHRRNLVDQFLGELHDRGYGDRESPPLLDGAGTDRSDGPVTVETYQWFVRNAGRISDAYTIVICDEAHTALGEKTSAAIRAWTGPIFIGMTATGALIARHVTDLFPTQTSRFDLAQAARRGVIAPLRCIRIPPGPGVRTIAKVPLRRGDVDVEFDQEMLAELLDQLPFNMAIADLYKTRFNGVPGVDLRRRRAPRLQRRRGVPRGGHQGRRPCRARRPSASWPRSSPRYERGEIDVLVNAQLLAEGWNSPRATVCMHLAPTASKRIYQQRVGRVTRRHPGKEAGVVVDFVHPATKHDDPVVTLHSLLDRDVYRGGAIVVGPVRRGRGRRVRVERRVIPVTADEERRHEVFERELWRIAVEHLDYGEQHMWAALAGARVAPSGWRRARAMLHFDRTGELKRRFLLTAVERNRNSQLRVRALQEIAAAKDAEAFDLAIDVIGTWSRDERREGVKVMLQALAEKRIGRRDQANAWIWRLAEYTREVHEEYAVQRWPETKRLLGLLVNSQRRRARAQRAPARARGAQAGPPPAGRAARRRASRTRRRPRRCCAARARAWPASRARCRASCCATSPRARAAARGAGARRRPPRRAGAAGAGAAQTRAGPDEEALDDAVATTTADGASSNGGRRRAGERRRRAAPPRRPHPGRARAARAGARTPTRRATRRRRRGRRRRGREPHASGATASRERQAPPSAAASADGAAPRPPASAVRAAAASEAPPAPDAPDATSERCGGGWPRPTARRREAQAQAAPYPHGAGGQEGRRRTPTRRPPTRPPTRRRRLRRRRRPRGACGAARASASSRAEGGGDARSAATRRRLRPRAARSHALARRRSGGEPRRRASSTKTRGSDGCREDARRVHRGAHARGRRRSPRTAPDSLPSTRRSRAPARRR